MMVPLALDGMIFKLAFCFGEKRCRYRWIMHANTLSVYFGLDNGIEMDQRTDYTCSSAQYQKENSCVQYKAVAEDDRKKRRIESLRHRVIDPNEDSENENNSTVFSVPSMDKEGTSLYRVFRRKQ